MAAIIHLIIVRQFKGRACSCSWIQSGVSEGLKMWGGGALSAPLVEIGKLICQNLGGGVVHPPLPPVSGTPKFLVKGRGNRCQTQGARTTFFSKWLISNGFQLWPCLIKSKIVRVYCICLLLTELDLSTALKADSILIVSLLSRLQHWIEPNFSWKFRSKGFLENVRKFENTKFRFGSRQNM